MFSIDKNEVFRYLGYNGQQISSDIHIMIDDLINKATEICTPTYTHMVSDIKTTDSGILLTGTDIVLTGNDIYNHLKDAKKCITLASTLGIHFETELLRLQSQSMTKAIIFDAIGTAFIEEFTDNIEEKLLLPFKREGYFSKFRYSPGYGDLPLELQNIILNTLQCDKKIGLTITETNILIPRKSVTAFIGIFISPQVTPNSKCDLCANKETCKIRKDGNFCD